MSYTVPFFIGGVERGTAFSELIDPVIQRRVLEDQSRRAAAGDEEAMQLDEDFLRALEFGAHLQIITHEETPSGVRGYLKPEISKTLERYSSYTASARARSLHAGARRVGDALED